MNIDQYFLSLTKETDALKNRVRFLIEDRHWQTDGEWKESVIRQILRRYLPSSVTVGRGFVIAAGLSSNQIDVLIFDSSKPVLFRDGDLVFVTPDAVLGAIEVKSRTTPGGFAEAARKLGENMEGIRRAGRHNAFAGFFAFDYEGGSSQAYLEAISEASPSWHHRIDFVALGETCFIKYWHLDPESGARFYERWHSYDLPQTAPGYFIHNVIDAISPESVLRNNDVWFPAEGKEGYRRGAIPGKWPNRRRA